MKPIIFEFTDGNEYLSSHSGLGLVGALLARTKIKKCIDKIQLPGCMEPKIPHHDIIYSMTGLLCLGKPDFDAIEPFRSDRPASSTLRQRLDVVGNYFDQIIKEESASLISHTAPNITPITSSTCDYIPLDIDVSPFDNSNRLLQNTTFLSFRT